MYYCFRGTHNQAHNAHTRNNQERLWGCEGAHVPSEKLHRSHWACREWFPNAWANAHNREHTGKPYRVSLRPFRNQNSEIFFRSHREPVSRDKCAREIFPFTSQANIALETTFALQNFFGGNVFVTKFSHSLGGICMPKHFPQNVVLSSDGSLDRFHSPIRS